MLSHLLLCFFGCLFFGISSSAFEVGKTYKIENVANGLAVDLYYRGLSNASIIVSYPYRNHTNQQWKCTQGASGLLLSTLASSTEQLYMEKDNKSLRVQIWSFFGMKNQYWYTEPVSTNATFYSIINVQNKYALTSHGYDQQLSVEIQDKANPLQLWTITEV